MSQRTRINNFKDIQLKTGGNIVAVLNRGDGSKEYWYANNIVTNQGDRYYSATIVGTAFPAATSTADFKASNWMHLGTSTTAAAKTDTGPGSSIVSGSISLTAGYPAVNASDVDSDNTGGNAYNIVSWGYSFGTGVANVNSINEGAVLAGSLVGNGTCLTHFLFGASFNKTSSDTLKIFVNHTFSGV